MDTKIFQAKNNESGTFGELLSDVEVSSVIITPVPAKAPGVVVARPGTEFEEHIYYRERDAIAGTIIGLTRDYTNLNGGSGREHLSGAGWETQQAAEYLNNVVDALIEGYVQEPYIATKVDADTFTVEKNRTSIYTKGRVLRFNQDNTVIGSVLADSTYNSGTGLTTVETEGVTIPTITTVEYGIAPKGAVGDLVKETATQVLTNKDLSSATNTFPAFPITAEVTVFAPGSSTIVGDGRAMFTVPAKMNGMNLVGIRGDVYTAGTTGNLDIQIRNVTQAADMLSTKMRIETGEVSTSTSAQPGVIDTANDDVATGDRIAIDIDAVQSGTAAKGLVVQLLFELP